jgi:hypothetical protein
MNTVDHRYHFGRSGIRGRYMRNFVQYLLSLLQLLGQTMSFFYTASIFTNVIIGVWFCLMRVLKLICLLGWDLSMNEADCSKRWRWRAWLANPTEVVGFRHRVLVGRWDGRIHQSEPLFAYFRNYWFFRISGSEYLLNFRFETTSSLQNNGKMTIKIMALAQRYKETISTNNNNESLLSSHQ